MLQDSPECRTASHYSAMYRSLKPCTASANSLAATRWRSWASGKLPGAATRTPVWPLCGGRTARKGPHVHRLCLQSISPACRGHHLPPPRSALCPRTGSGPLESWHVSAHGRRHLAGGLGRVRVALALARMPGASPPSARSAVARRRPARQTTAGLDRTGLWRCPAIRGPAAPLRHWVPR